MKLSGSTGSSLGTLSLALSCVLQKPAFAADVGCEAVDLAGYFQDHYMGDGDFAARVVTVDGGEARPGLAIPALVSQVLRGSYQGSRILIRPIQVSGRDLVPMKGDGGILIGRILAVEQDIAVVDPLRAETPRQRAERGEDFVRGVTPPPKPPAK